jgi:hypothetical protein
MDLRQIKVCDLLTYIDSAEFINSQVIPITRHRAISQYHNPDAGPEDTALVLAYDKSNEVVGYIGILPEHININGRSEKIYTNSGWWVHPQKGRAAAMPLFYKMLDLCKDKMFFADLTPHTTQILLKTGLFEFPEPVIGFRGYLQYSFHTILPGKFKFFRYLRPVMELYDNFFNAIRGTGPGSRVKKLLSQSNIRVEEIYESDAESEKFIENHPSENITFRNKEALNWIIKYPWLRTGNEKTDQEARKYYFSTVAKEFNYHFRKVYRNNELMAVMLLTSRNRHFKVPYYFCQPADLSILPVVILKIITEKKALSLTTWQAELCAGLAKTGSGSFVHKKRISKQEAYSRGFPGLSLSSFRIQDGEGDMAFT